MGMLGDRLRAGALGAVLATPGALALPGHAGAIAAPRYQSNDYCRGQCHDILPPGENGNATLADILANRTLGTRPGHTDDQLGPYSSLVDGYTGLTDATLGSFFDDASFGVPSGQVASTV